MSTETSSTGSTGSTGSTAGATGTDDAPVTVTRDHRPGVRVGTIVWGLILGLLGVGVLLVSAGYVIDVQLAAIVLLIAAGLGLILGPLVQGLRRGRSAEG